jgi:CRISPR-associated Csx2 family protein
MKKVLISFLGKKPGGKSYQETGYEFSPGDVERTSFFGLALARRVRPRQLVVLGTVGSMWDVLIEHLLGESLPETEAMELIEKVSQNGITQAQLDRLAPRIEQAMGIACRLQLIPFGRDQKQQIKILRAMSEHVAHGDEVHMDLTHGLRHLPMLGLLSALYLREARKAVVAGIYYGAFELGNTQDDGVRLTPVLRLEGLLRVADWVRALAIYDHTSDYSVFAPLLQQEGLNNTLAEAAFFERIFNPEKARQKLTGIHLPELKEKTIGGLFAEDIETRIDWYRKSARSEQEKQLARTYLEKREYVRAVTYGYEALATALVEKKAGNICDFEQRDKAIKEAGQQDPAIRQFAYLRNELVHGCRSRNAGIQRLVDNERQLIDYLQDFFAHYLS